VSVESHYSVLAGKNCFLSGASGGIGREIAVALARKKVNLFLTSRSEDKLKVLTAALRAKNAGIKIGYAAADLVDPAALEVVAQQAGSCLGRIDILINCAGFFQVESLTASSLADFEYNIAVNLRPIFFFARIFSSQMRSNGWGRIINIGSSSAYGGTENTSLYCMVKHGVLGFSRALGAELKRDNVRVFCLSPAGTKTVMGESIPNQNYETFLAPAEIAEYLVFAISFDGEMITDELRLNRMVMV